MSTLSCLALWSSYKESVAARWGFRAFKKALVSPYSAKVNNRESSSRKGQLGLTAPYRLSVVKCTPPVYRTPFARGGSMYPLEVYPPLGGLVVPLA